MTLSVELVDADGEFVGWLLDDFFVVPEVDVQRENDLKAGETLVVVRRSGCSPSARPRFICAKPDKLAFDWPIADVAVVLERDDQAALRPRGHRPSRRRSRLSPRRALSAEELLIGKPVDDGLAGAAGEAALEGATPLAKHPVAADFLRAGGAAPCCAPPAKDEERTPCCPDAL